MNSVCCDGISLEYSIEGCGSLPVLVVGSSIFYPRTFSARLKRSFRFVCADFPHFVDIPAEFDLASIGFEVYADCVERIRIAAGLERVVVVGHSHHGNIAVEYAKRFRRHDDRYLTMKPVRTTGTAGSARGPDASPDARRDLIRAYSSTSRHDGGDT